MNECVISNKNNATVPIFRTEGNPAIMIALLQYSFASLASPFA